jgi:hypothetical protein
VVFKLTLNRIQERSGLRLCIGLNSLKMYTVVTTTLLSTSRRKRKTGNRRKEQSCKVILILFNCSMSLFLYCLSLSTGTATWAYMDHLSNGKRELGLRTRRPDTLVCSSCSALSSEVPCSLSGMLTIPSC